MCELATSCPTAITRSGKSSFLSYLGLSTGAAAFSSAWASGGGCTRWCCRAWCCDQKNDHRRGAAYPCGWGGGRAPEAATRL